MARRTETAVIGQPDFLLKTDLELERHRGSSEKNEGEEE